MWPQHVTGKHPVWPQHITGKHLVWPQHITGELFVVIATVCESLYSEVICEEEIVNTAI